MPQHVKISWVQSTDVVDYYCVYLKEGGTSVTPGYTSYDAKINKGDLGELLSWSEGNIPAGQKRIVVSRYSHVTGYHTVFDITKDIPAGQTGEFTVPSSERVPDEITSISAEHLAQPPEQASSITVSYSPASPGTISLEHSPNAPASVQSQEELVAPQQPSSISAANTPAQPSQVEAAFPISPSQPTLLEISTPEASVTHDIVITIHSYSDFGRWYMNYTGSGTSPLFGGGTFNQGIRVTKGDTISITNNSNVNCYICTTGGSYELDPATNQYVSYTGHSKQVMHAAPGASASFVADKDPSSGHDYYFWHNPPIATSSSGMTSVDYTEANHSFGDNYADVIGVPQMIVRSSVSTPNAPSTVTSETQFAPNQPASIDSGILPVEPALLEIYGPSTEITEWNTIYITYNDPNSATGDFVTAVATGQPQPWDGTAAENNPINLAKKGDWLNFQNNTSNDVWILAKGMFTVGGTGNQTGPWWNQTKLHLAGWSSGSMYLTEPITSGVEYVFSNEAPRGPYSSSDNFLGPQSGWSESGMTIDVSEDQPMTLLASGRGGPPDAPSSIDAVRWVDKVSTITAIGPTNWSSSNPNPASSFYNGFSGTATFRMMGHESWLNTSWPWRHGEYSSAATSYLQQYLGYSGYFDENGNHIIRRGLYMQPYYSNTTPVTQSNGTVAGPGYWTYMPDGDWQKTLDVSGMVLTKTENIQFVQNPLFNNAYYDGSGYANYSIRPGARFLCHEISGRAYGNYNTTYPYELSSQHVPIFSGLEWTVGELSTESVSLMDPWTRAHVPEGHPDHGHESWSDGAGDDPYFSQINNGNRPKSSWRIDNVLVEDDGYDSLRDNHCYGITQFDLTCLE